MYRVRDHLPPDTEPCNARCSDCHQRARAVLRDTGDGVQCRVPLFEVTLYDVLPHGGRRRHRHQHRALFLPGHRTPAGRVR